MAIRRWRKLAILHKIETDYGVDAAPVAADALIGSNVTFTPLEGEEVSRDLILPYMGNQGVILAGLYGRLEFDIEIAGSGAAGTAPAYGSLLRVCGLSETITPDTSVEYSIIEDGQESGSLYFISDKVQHVLVGGRATMTMTFTPKGIPRFRFTYQGLIGTITDIGTMPAVSMTQWMTPLVVSKANSVMSLHGWAAVAESLSVDLGNTLTPRFLIGDEVMAITDRSLTGTAVVEARDLATVNWFDIALTRARGVLSFVHGKTAGNIVEIAAPKVELGRPTQGQTDGVVNYSLPLMLCPENGLDELVLTIR
ncbi:phage tail tube protein (plasmid) [Thioclava sp. 'Guangxiensis']|uniref:phage tail tube protein n=1 Tax=Thioclava sp. 'Guangxiensis' TaxID=3149044 RepID=UPI0032C48F5F